MTTSSRPTPRSTPATVEYIINARGEVIGINGAIFSRTGGSIGIGFAVPVNLAKFVVPQLAESGQVDQRLARRDRAATDGRGPAAGLRLPRSEGALVSQVWEGSPAAAAGLYSVVMSSSRWTVARSGTTDLSLLVAATPSARTSRCPCCAKVSHSC